MTTRFLVAENQWPLPGAGTTSKGVRMTILSEGPPGMAPNRDHRDAPPRRVLPLVVVVLRSFYQIFMNQDLLSHSIYQEEDSQDLLTTIGGVHSAVIKYQGSNKVEVNRERARI